MKIKARIRKMGNTLVMTMPKSAVWVTGFSEGEILEIDVKGKNMIIARKLDDVGYVNSKDLKMHLKKKVTKEPIIA